MTAAETIAPLTALGVECRHHEDSYGTRAWIGRGAAIDLYVTHSSGVWSVSAMGPGQSRALASGISTASLEDAEAACEADAAATMALLAGVRRAR